MFNDIDETKLEETIKRANLSDIKALVDFKLAHELAHCLRDQDTEKFIFIYDFKIPEIFDSQRLDTLKENSRILSELNETEFAKVCDDLKCEMEQNRIVKNEEYFRHKSAVDSKDRIKYENEALVKKFLDDSDEERGFSLPKLTSQCSPMCRDGFVTNYRYQTFKDNKRNETQLTSCYDEVYTVKNNESDDVESEEKLSSSASSSISFRSAKNSDHVIINMTHDDDDNFVSFENKYRQQEEYLETLKNECQLGTCLTTSSNEHDAARSNTAYKLIAKSQMERSNLNKSDRMKDDFTKICDESNESDNSQFLLNDIISKLVQKNNHKVSSLQFNNYKFDVYDKSEAKISAESIDSSRLVCKNDNLDSHGSSMTNSSKHEDEDEEKDDDDQLDYDHYFVNAQQSDKSDCLKKTIDELSTKHVSESKKKMTSNDSIEATNSIKNVPASAGFHQKFQNCAYYLNCSNSELQQQDKSAEDKSIGGKKIKSAPNEKKSKKKGSNNQNESKNNSMYSKHWMEDVDSLLEFITSTSIKSEQKTNKAKKQNTELSTPNNSNNKSLGKKNKKSESDSRQKQILADNSDVSKKTELKKEKTVQEAPQTKTNDSNLFPQIEQNHAEIQQELAETEFVTVIKGKKVKKDKESKEQIEITKNESLISNQTRSKNNSSKNLEKKSCPIRQKSVETKPPVILMEIKNESETKSTNEDPAKFEKPLETSEQIEIVETKQDNLISKISTSSETDQKENGSETDQNENRLKKSTSTSSNKKTPVVFMDEIFTKKPINESIPLDIKFGLSTDEEAQAEEPVDPKTNDSDTDQTILVKKKTRSKRNKSTRTASKQLDLIQNNYSSDSSLNPSTSCDELETSYASKNLKTKKSLRKKNTESASESAVNSQETEQSSSGLSYQGYYAQPYVNQYQPYLIYQIDPNTNLPVALIPVNAYNMLPQPNPDTTSPINNLNQYYTAMDLNAYNYQMANYQYMQQLGLNYQPNMVPMTYSVLVPPTGPVESANQGNVHAENQTQSSIGQQNSYHAPLNYNYNHYPGNYASYPSFSSLNNNSNNNYMQKSNSFSMPSNHSETNVNQNVKSEHHSIENSELSNKNVSTSNAKIKNPRYPK